MASQKRSWLSPTKCSSSFITSCVPRNPTLIWVLSILTNGIGNGSDVTIFTALPQLGYTVTLLPKEAALDLRLQGRKASDGDAEPHDIRALEGSCHLFSRLKLCV